MANPYSQVCATPNCSRLVEVIVDDEGPWTNGYCGQCNDKKIAHANAQAEFLFFHSSLSDCKCRGIVHDSNCPQSGT